MLFPATVLDPAPRPDGSPPPLPPEWVRRHQASLVTIGKAAAANGCTGNELRIAISEGELDSYLTDGGTHMVEPADVATWVAHRQQHGPAFSPKAAAEHVGIGYERLRSASRSGALPS